MQQSLVAGKSAPAVAGLLAPQQALDRLLAGSGLVAVSEGAAVVIRPTPTHGSGAALPAVTVTADASPQAPTGPVAGLVARRSLVATKTDTPILEVAQSISVVTRDQMDAQGVQTVEQSLRYTSGVLTEVTGYDLRYASLNIRGFDATLYRDGLRVFKTGTYGDWLTEPQPAGTEQLYTASLFDLRRQNVTTLDPASAALRVQTGEVRSRGLELEAKARITVGLDLLASYTYLDAKVTRSNDAQELGKRPFQTARNTAKLWLGYALPGEALRGWSLGLGLRRVGPTVADTYNRYWNEGYTLVDAAVHYAQGPIRFSLNVANLGDKVTTANRAQFYGQGRSVMATVGYRW